MTQPDVFTYIDHRAYLDAWFAWKCKDNPRYSHRAFARRAGVSNPSLLHLVVKGDRNLTARTLPGFIQALGLGRDQEVHFRSLVDLSRARTDAERSTIFERIRSTRHFRQANALEADGFAYLSDWTVPALRELVGAPSFVAEPEWMAARLRPSVSPARARRSFEILRRLGMVVEDGDGGWLVEDVAVVTPHEVGGLAVFNYHRQMMQRAGDALETEAEHRHFGAVTVRVPADRLQVLKDEVAAFQERILSLCDDDHDGEVVVQLNLQLFPLSQVLPCDS